MLTKKIKQAIIDHAIECEPRESCGLIVDREYLACTNISNNDGQFEICPKDFIKAESLGKIKAIVHSHPQGSTDLTMPDREQMSYHKLPWIVTNIEDVALHKYTNYQAPLLGREYHHGLMDCYSLVKDYYHRELDITLNDYERDDAWWEDAKSDPLYLDNFKAEGFVEVETLQKHDAILCRLGRTEHVNHALIFVGDGALKSEPTDDVIGDSLVLHHPYNRESLREIYGDNWMRRAAIIIRHKSLI